MKKNIACFGEVLWDVFPTHENIGGAPLNVAMRLKCFGNNVAMISAIGTDTKGTVLLDFIKKNGVNTGCVKLHNTYATGSVKVTLNQKGSATYDIEYPRAWDKIVLTEDNKKITKNADAFVYGSLASRDAVSRETLYALLELANYKIFDLNLRPPHYTNNVLFYLMDKADFIKFNDDELYEVSKSMGSVFNSLEQNLMYIAEKTNTKHICVTMGNHGAILLYNGKLYYNCGYLIKVVDTVGAGDSFLGALISKLLNDSKPQEAIDFACAVGALVAQSKGANPNIPLTEIHNFINPK